MASLDTNILLLLVSDKDSSEAKAARRLTEMADEDELTVSDGALFECAKVLASEPLNLSREAVGDKLLQLADTPQLNISRDLIKRVVPYYRAALELSFLDIAIVLHAEEGKGLPFVTTNQALAELLPDQTHLLEAD